MCLNIDSVQYRHGHDSKNSFLYQSDSTMQDVYFIPFYEFLALALSFDYLYKLLVPATKVCSGSGSFFFFFLHANCAHVASVWRVQIDHDGLFFSVSVKWRTAKRSSATSGLKTWFFYDSLMNWLLVWKPGRDDVWVRDMILLPCLSETHNTAFPILLLTSHQGLKFIQFVS